MYGVHLVDNSGVRCVHFFGSNVTLDWNGLVGIGILFLLFELTVYLALRLKYIYIPFRFMIGILILSAILLAEGLPALFTQFGTHC